MKRTWTALLAAWALSTLMALAADQPTAPPGNDGAGPRGGPPGGRGAGQGRGFGGMMMLDEQQRQLFDQALQKENDRLRALEGKMRTAQQELLEATLASTYDEKTVRAKAEAVAAIQVEMTTLRAKALAAIAPTLKPEQKEQILQTPVGVMLLNGGPGMGRPPGFQGGGRGGPPGGGPGGFGGEGREGPPRER